MATQICLSHLLRRKKAEMATRICLSHLLRREKCSQRVITNCCPPVVEDEDATTRMNFDRKRFSLLCRLGSPPSQSLAPSSSQLRALSLHSSVSGTIAGMKMSSGHLFSRSFTSSCPTHACDKSYNRSSFEVIEGDNKAFLHQIGVVIDETKNEFGDTEMKERYLKVVKPQLMSRGLILPQKLKHSSTRFIHNRSLAISGKTPKYMSVADIMSHEKRMEEQEWNHFLTYMIKARIYVVEDWDSTLCQIETLFYDHGIIEPDDGSETEMFKGDFDAAFDEDMQEANLGFIIFRGRDIHHCQVNFSVPCTSSVMAEAYAAAALLMKASDLGIKKLLLWTDNMEVRGVLNGDHNIKVEDVNRGIFVSLRKLRKNFEKVITLWKARELNQMADDLVTLDKATLLHPTFPLQALERWRPHLEGQPIFRFKQIDEIKLMIYKFGQGRPYEGSTSKVVMLEVGEVCKFDCLLGLLEGFDPDDMYVQVHEFDTRPEDLKLKFMEFFSKARADAVDGISFFHRDCNSARKDNRKAILVVFDSNLWERTFYTNGLTVVLVSPEEANFRGRHNLRRLSALDYALFSSEKE